MSPREIPQAAWTAAAESPSARRLAPFAAVSLIGLVAAIGAADLDTPEIWVAIGLGLAAALMVLLLPWRRLPRWAGAVPAIVYLAAVAFLRDAAGGPVAGLAGLVLLPVLWLALYGNTLQLALTIPAVAATFIVPMLLVGEPTYPSDQWYAAVTFVALALLIGPIVQRLIGRVKAQAADARSREREVARVAEVARRLSTGDGTRRDVCGAACQIGDSSFALLWEPNDAGRLAITASAGIDPPSVELDPNGERTGATVAWRTASSVFVADAQRDPLISRRLLDEMPPTGSILFQPVMRHGEPAGVLVVGWRDRVDQAAGRLRMMVGLLAAEAGIAIERADLLTQLEELADTDELTGLPNRRGWNREWTVAMSTADRRGTPLCVALIDVDFFKAVNDERGHQAGDRLLKAAAAAWRSTLRPADVLARPGGDEFTLLLPDCDLDRAGTVLERLREATPGGRTCSIGVAQWDGAEDTDELIARADEALYRAKDTGRDRVVTA